MTTAMLQCKENQLMLVKVNTTSNANKTNRRKTGEPEPRKIRQEIPGA